jgi:hypothetical protein
MIISPCEHGFAENAEGNRDLNRTFPLRAKLYDALTVFGPV